MKHNFLGTFGDFFTAIMCILISFYIISAVKSLKTPDSESMYGGKNTIAIPIAIQSTTVSRKLFSDQSPTEWDYSPS